MPNKFLSFSIAALVVCASIATAQRSKRRDKWKIDPYTKNDEQLMEKLGIWSFGPFEFGQRGERKTTTTDIENHLSYEQIRWVETDHFKIGLMLPKWSVPMDPTVKKKLRAEITRLRERSGIRKFNPKTRTLDPWLRIHLTAQRMEDHYALFQDWLGVTDKSFPSDPSAVIIGEGEYMGQGPYLGQTGKYLVFVSESVGTMTDYLKNFTGRDTIYGQRWNFKLPGEMFYGVATEMYEGQLKHDTALHSHLVFNVTHNLLDGYKFYAYETPVWIRVGLAHYFERLISPKWNTFDANEGSPADMKKAWRWEIQTRKFLSSGKYAAFSEAYTWRDYGQIKFNDHVMVWSRWDYLTTLGKDKFAKFIGAIKGRVNPETYIPDDSDLVEATRHALRDAYGLTPLTLEERWKEWVKANYATN